MNQKSVLFHNLMFALRLCVPKSHVVAHVRRRARWGSGWAARSLAHEDVQIRAETCIELFRTGGIVYHHQNTTFVELGRFVHRTGGLEAGCVWFGRL